MSRNVRNTIEAAIRNSITQSMIEDAILVAIENMDFSDKVSEAVEETIGEYLGEYIDGIVGEVVGCVVEDALEEAFN